MDYLKAIRRNISWIIILLSCLILSLCDSTEGAISKIPYNKAIGGKENYPQQRVELENSANTSLTNDTKSGFEDMENSTDLTLTLTPPREANLSLQSDYKSITTPMYNEIATTPTPLSNIKTFLMTTTSALEKAKNTPIGKQKNKEKIPCTCGIFLSSQFSKGSAVPPRGEAVISNSIDRTFACNNVGQKQCQTKCLQQIVQHLPNSANILCASLDRDVRKERAYLFIKNCENKWISTNLAAGREYCCKNREPCSCKT